MKGYRWAKKQLYHALTILRKHPNPTLEKETAQLASLLDNKEDLPEIIKTARVVKQEVKKSWRHHWFSRGLTLIGTLLAALAIAGVIRQTWFELYEIPTGSMRPTFKEQDRVIVSKTAFGLNVPFTPRQITFSKNRIERGSLVVISAENLDIPHVDTKYFGIFPGKKRYVKRCVALPGDRIYFYGGDLYCLTKKNTLHRLKENPLFQHFEYLPFIAEFEGRIEITKPSPFSRQQTIFLKHLNQSIGRINISQAGTIQSSIRDKEHWIPEFSSSPSITRSFPKTIGEFFGIKNFATCRLLLPNELPQTAKKLGYQDPKALCWLELHHSPTMPTSPKEMHLPISLLKLCTTWIPLYEEHCHRILQNLYTARVLIKSGKVKRYYFETNKLQELQLPRKIPDGCYEFYYGTAYKIRFGGYAEKLPKSHPIYPTSIKELLFWFNAGINVQAENLSPFSQKMPARFAYFRENNLIIMNTPIFLDTDPILSWFASQEITRQAKDYHYFAFQDEGAPTTDPINIEFFNNFGFHVPENHYLLLGDNPVMSLDSRFFGAVPQDNIRGSPIALFWPFGSRWGRPPQPPLSLSLWGILFSILTGTILIMVSRYQRHRITKQLDQLKKKYFHDV